MIRDSTDVLIERLRSRLNPFLDSTSPDRRASAIRIGLLISNQAKLNIRAKRLIDTGRLLNSIGFDVKDGAQTVIEVGSFGVPYAAIHEFGFSGAVGIRAHARTVNTIFGRQLSSPVVQNVRAHSRNVRIPARPYLRPALKSTAGRVLDIVRALLK
jgi:phage gpG-like protein